MRSTERGIRSVDLLGNLLSDLTAYLGAPAGGVPGGLHKFDEKHHLRTEALTVVVKHDDGCRLDNLGRADIVLVGVSRTSKTPLSIYLAVRGYFVANVPIVYGVEPPQELFRIDQRKIVGMRMDPNRLNHVRQQRLKQYREDTRKAYVGRQCRSRFGSAVGGRRLHAIVLAGCRYQPRSLSKRSPSKLSSLATNLPYRRPPDDFGNVMEVHSDHFP